MSEKYLKELKVGELNEQDLEWLLRSTEASYTGMQPVHVMVDAAEGRARIWRVADGKGILVTKVLEHPAGWELYILCIAGQGLFELFNDGAEEFFDLARQHKCRYIGCLVERAGMERILNHKLNFEPKLTYCLAEVPNATD